MAESGEKLRHDHLHVRVIFYEQNMGHKLTTSVVGPDKGSREAT